MSVQYNAVTVTNVATLILPSNPSRRGALVYNNGTVTVYLGFDSSVTSTTGLPLVAGATYNDSGDSDLYRSDIYGITASSSSDVRFHEWTP